MNTTMNREFAQWTAWVGRLLLAVATIGAVVACADSASDASRPMMGYGAVVRSPQAQQAQSVQIAQASLKALDALKPGDALDWTMPDDSVLKLSIASVQRDAPGTQVLIASDGKSGHLTLAVASDDSGKVAMQASLRDGQEHWRYRSDASGTWVQGRLRDNTLSAPEHSADVMDATHPSIAGARLEAETMPLWHSLLNQGRAIAAARLDSAKPSLERAKADADLQHMDVQFLVAPSLQALYGSNAARDADIALLVASANAAFNAANVQKIRLRRVSTVVLNADVGQTPQLSLLAQLRDGLGVFASAWQSQRDSGADIVALLIPFRDIDVADGNCGRGYQNTFRSGGTFGGDRLGYSVISRLNSTASTSSCSDSQFAHELGHNLGNAHDRISAPTSVPSREYARGYTVAGSFRDLMGLGTPARIDLFSNPDAMCLGQPCGLPVSNAQSADAARNVRETAGLLARALDPRTRYTGWYVVSDELGTGWAIEIQDNRIFAAYFAYDDSGQPTWFAGAGTECAANRFCIMLNRYTGGATAAGPYLAPTGTPIQTATFTLDESTNFPSILLATGNRNQRLSRFNINETPTAFSAKPKYPNYHRPGWFWDSSAGGTGMFLETQGETSFVGYFFYRDDGSPTWLASRGNRYSTTLAADGTVSAFSAVRVNFQSYSGGQTLTGPFKTPIQTSTNAANGLLQFEQDQISVTHSGQTRNSTRFVPFREF